ncbi:MAG: autotransporter-associated beta strand repeat-containing protein, partial [bacterium]
GFLGASFQEVFSTNREEPFFLNGTDPGMGTAQYLVGGVTNDAACIIFTSATSVTNTFTLKGFAGTVSGRLRFNGNTTMTGAILLEGDSRLSMAGAYTVNLNGPISKAPGTSVSELRLNGFGNSIGLYVLGATNGFDALRIDRLTRVRLNSGGAMNPVLGSESTLIFNAFYNATSTGGIFRVNGNSVTLGTLTNDLSTLAIPDVVENASSTNVTLTIGNAQNRSGAFSGIIQDGAGGGKLNLVKAGTGTLTLLNTNTYSGTTTVNMGTLVMTNVIASTNWSVASAGAVTVNGSLDLSGKVLTLGADTNSAGSVSVTGNLTLGGVLTVVSAVPVTMPVRLFSCTGTLSGDVTSLNATLPAGVTLVKMLGSIWLRPADKSLLVYEGFDVPDRADGAYFDQSAGGVTSWGLQGKWAVFATNRCLYVTNGLAWRYSLPGIQTVGGAILTTGQVYVSRSLAVAPAVTNIYGSFLLRPLVDASIEANLEYGLYLNDTVINNGYIMVEPNAFQQGGAAMGFKTNSTSIVRIAREAGSSYITTNKTFLAVFKVTNVNQTNALVTTRLWIMTQEQYDHLVHAGYPEQIEARLDSVALGTTSDTLWARVKGTVQQQGGYTTQWLNNQFLFFYNNYSGGSMRDCYFDEIRMGEVLNDVAGFLPRPLGTLIRIF